MKKMSYVLAISVFFLIAGQLKTTAAPVDTTAARMEIMNLLEKFHHAMVTMDRKSMSPIMTEDILLFGTDPNEIMNKEQAMGMMNENGVTYSDDSNMMKYKVDKRRILLADDGKSAIVIEQFMLPAFSKTLPVRLITHVKQTPEGWKFDLVSWNFIPENKDLPIIDKALGSEKGDM